MVVCIFRRGENPHQSALSIDFHRDAVESVRQMELKAEEPEGGKRTSSTASKQHKGIEGITRVELSAKWDGVVNALKRGGVNVTNPDHALEGALSIRYGVHFQMVLTLAVKLPVDT